PDGSRVYITSDEDVLDVMDRKTGKHIKKVPLSGHGDGLAVTKDGRRVLVCTSKQTEVDRNATKLTPAALDIIDTNSLEKVKSIPVKSGLHNVEVTPDGKYAVTGSPLGRFITV